MGDRVEKCIEEATAAYMNTLGEITAREAAEGVTLIPERGMALDMYVNDMAQCYAKRSAENTCALSRRKTLIFEEGPIGRGFVMTNYEEKCFCGEKPKSTSEAGPGYIRYQWENTGKACSPKTEQKTAQLTQESSSVNNSKKEPAQRHAPTIPVNDGEMRCFGVCAFR